jgi:succinate-semialdehyde dehydrogenase/glutarate-semialdehyde dehydrogenase
MPIETNFWQEEIFAPIVAIKSFSSDEEALILANNQAYGLASYCYTVTNSRMENYIKNLDFGMVAMNSGVLSTSVAPFGGRKESGFGREGGSEGIAEYLDVKMIHLGVV